MRDGALGQSLSTSLLRNENRMSHDGRANLAVAIIRWFKGPSVDTPITSQLPKSTGVEELQATGSFGKKRVFVGSSTEGRPIAERVLVYLRKNGLHTLPWFDFFGNSRPPLQELEHLTLQVDGAVLVATPDDEGIIRQRRWHQARDNVLFEYGLFAGAIGRRKCALLIPDIDTFRIPSDFLGVACCERFELESPDTAAELSAASLAAALVQPPRSEDLQVRGRRLLQLLGWVRDEAFRLVQEWQPDHGHSVVASRVIAVSGFVREDIDNLGLRKEYDEIERLLLAAIDDFPRRSSGFDRSELEDRVRRWLPGEIAPNRDVFGTLLENIEREGILRRFSGSYSNCCTDFWRYFRQRSHMWDWYDRNHWWWRHDWPDSPPFLCGAVGWAAGVAEAAHAFELHLTRLDPLGPLRHWSRECLPQLNNAIIAFERRLHEAIFGAL